MILKDQLFCSYFSGINQKTKQTILGSLCDYGGNTSKIIWYIISKKTTKTNEGRFVFD